MTDVHHHDEYLLEWFQVNVEIVFAKTMRVGAIE